MTDIKQAGEHGAQKRWQDRTRGGFPVRIYAEDANIHGDIHGAVNTGTGYIVVAWDKNGEHGSHTMYDLLPIKKTKRVFKTLDELARDYNFHCCDGVITIYLADTAYDADTRLWGITHDHSPKWLEIFTKTVEVEE